MSPRLVVGLWSLAFLVTGTLGTPVIAVWAVSNSDLLTGLFSVVVWWGAGALAFLAGAAVQDGMPKEA